MKKQLLISFSGGRTSGYMTKILLDNLNEKKYEIKVIFANTGKEREETLEFIHECDLRWNFNTIWVECVTNPQRGKGPLAKVVNFQTANRTGKPFEECIKKHGLPNIAQPLCTRQLKTYTINAYMRQIGWKKFHRAIGIRADEIDRADPEFKKKRIVYPLISIFPTVKQDINNFWIHQEFDLKLKSYEGNCDCCYKKSLRKLLTIAKESPEKFSWWQEMEKKYENFIPEGRRHNENIKLPQRFYRERLSVREILEMSKNFKDIARDDSRDIIQHKQLSLFGYDLDTPNGCSESCEPF